MKVELTTNQISELQYLLVAQSENQLRIDNIIIFDTGNIQVFYNDGKPKVKDISIYD